MDYLVTYNNEDCGFIKFEDDYVCSYCIFKFDIIKNYIDKIHDNIRKNDLKSVEITGLEFKEVNLYEYLSNKGLDLFIQHLQDEDINYILNEDNLDKLDNYLVNNYWGCFTPIPEMIKEKLNELI